MRLTQIRLKNFGPYEDSTFELSQGLIGIVGPNGSGKSTLVNGIYSCLTNDFSRFSGRKAGIIRDTAGESERSFVEVLGEHENVPFRLVRNLRPNSSKLEMGDVSYAKATDIETHLIRDLGLNRKLIDAYVFVNQWDIFSFLSQTDSKRAEVFQSLCGTEKSIDIYNACTKFLNDKALTADIVDNSDEIEVNLASLRSELAALKARREDCVPKLMRDKSRESAQMIVRKRDILVANQDELTDCKFKLKKLQERTVVGFETIRVKNLTIDSAVSIPDVRALHEYESQAVKELTEIQETAAAGLADLQEGKLLQDQAIKNQRRKEKLELRLVSLEKIKPVLSVPEESICPTCEQAVRDEKMREIVETEYNENVAAYQREMLKIGDELDSFEVNEEHLHFDSELYDRLFAERRHSRGQLSLFNLSLSQLDRKLGKLEGEADHLQDRIKGLESSLQGKSLAEYNEMYEKAERRLTQHNAIEHEIATLDGAIGVTEDAIHVNERLLVSLRKKLKNREVMDGLLDVVDKTRDLFHWQSLPRKVAQANLMAITGEINEALDLFGSPFWVEADTNLSFKVHFPGMPARDAAAISGGQKVVLAICFRSAVNRLFGDNIGMMFLDEPTSGLDNDNIEHFRGALTHMANKIRNKYQLFVITHEDALSSAFDGIISIG